MKIFIVIPAYNESRRIGKVLVDLAKYKLPIIVVDDGSNDDTSLIAANLKATVLRHRVNLGKGAALKTGFKSALKNGADAVIMIDADGQHKTSDLPEFLKVLKSGEYEVLLGVRILKNKVPAVRLMGNKLASFLVWLLFGIKVSDMLCGYRALTTKALKKMKLDSVGYGIETEMIVEIAKRSLKYCEVPVTTIYYDKAKGVTILDAINILFDVVIWRIAK